MSQNAATSVSSLTSQSCGNSLLVVCLARQLCMYKTPFDKSGCKYIIETTYMCVENNI